jgi:hypothetical protein
MRRGTSMIELAFVLVIAGAATEVVGSLLLDARRLEDGPIDHGAVVDAACDQLRRDLSAGGNAKLLDWSMRDGWLTRNGVNLVPGATLRVERVGDRTVFVIKPRRGPERRVEAP